MTAEQLAKINKLNKLHYAEMKLKSTYSIKRNDKRLSREFMEIIPEYATKNSVEKCKKEICDFYKTSVKNYIDALKEYKMLREHIEECINNVDDDELCAILKYRFIEYKTWEEISGEIYCSVRTAKYKYIKALNKICI